MTLATEQYRRWSKADYIRMAETGILADGERTELFEGSILTLSPNNPPHANSVSRLNMLLTSHFQTKVVRVQLPLDVSESSLPEPDFAVVAADALSDTSHPRLADLVIEVADSSLKFDRTEKMSLYARAGIQEYWVVNVADRVLEVYREPAEDSQAPLGWAYRRRVVLEESETVRPLSLEAAELPVGGMF
jgi:Uma2 family endonuclease